MGGKTTKKARSRTARGGATGTSGPTRPDRRVLALLEQIGPDFVEVGACKITAADVARATSRGAEILELFRRSPDLERFGSNAESMISMLADYTTGQYTSVPLRTIGVVSFALLYVLKPIDIIPDALPEIGRLDDALVVSHAIGLTKLDLQNYKMWRLAADIR